MKVYFIPGLGYDYRIFGNLEVSDLKARYLHWIEPKPHEKLHAYAMRMFEQVDEPVDEITLIGHSLGGIVAQEIAHAREIHTVILLSSIKARQEMLTFFKMIKSLPIEKLFTKEMSIRTVKYWGKNHGFETEEELELFKHMVGKQTNTYLQWALKALSSWQEPSIPAATRLIHIHGTNDKTFPIKRIQKPDFIIENGSHILVYKQATQISKILQKQIT